jgi:hypothetical protein
MGAVTIDVEAQIESLSGLKTDLDECFWRVDEASTRYALGIAISQLTQRIAALEEIVRHHGGGEAIAIELTLDESRALDRALGVLDGEIVLEAGREDRLWARIRLVLAAVDDLLLAAARGAREPAVGRDSGPRPGVVLPLVRSRR